MPTPTYCHGAGPDREPRLQQLLGRIRADAVAPYRTAAGLDELRTPAADDICRVATMQGPRR
jgi:hypothetical protein